MHNCLEEIKRESAALPMRLLQLCGVFSPTLGGESRGLDSTQIRKSFFILHLQWHKSTSVMNGQSSRDSKLAIEAIRLKCNKYTMDPGRQIYLSKNKKIFGKKMIFEQQNQKKFQDKKFFSEIFLRKTKFGRNFPRNFF